MQSKDRQKICNQCDGRIPIEASICPYCTAEQVIASPAEDEGQFYRNQSLQDSLTAPYSPLYSTKHSAYNLSDPNKSSPFSKQADPFKEVSAEKKFTPATPLGIPTIPQEMQQEQIAEEKTSFWPILCLSMGANLLVLGLLQLFFSERGFLRLEWNSTYWFAYCLAALPLVFLGYKKANQLK